MGFASLITAVVILLVAGAIMFFIYKYAPIPAIFKTAIYIVVFFGILIWMLNHFGLWKL